MLRYATDDEGPVTDPGDPEDLMKDPLALRPPEALTVPGGWHVEGIPDIVLLNTSAQWWAAAGGPSHRR